MKIEIDLNQILGDEYGQAETLAESVRRQVVDQITGIIQKGVTHKVNDEVAKQISEQVSTEISKRMPELLDDILNVEYTPVDRYGSRTKGSTTFRNELIKTIHEQMVYKKTSYASDRNAFTVAVDSIIEEQMRVIAKEYKTQVDEALGKKAFELAIDTLRTKLGLGK